MNRRSFYVSAIGLAFQRYGFAGAMSKPTLGELTYPTGLAPFAPKLVQSKTIPLAFDVHAHLFNAADVPVRGYVSESVGHSIENGILRKAVIAAAPFLEHLGNVFAISCRTEMEQIRGMLDRARASSILLINQSLRDEIDRNIEDHVSSILNELASRLPGSEFGNALDELDEEFQSRSNKVSGRSKLDIPLSKNAERIRSGLLSGSEPDDSDEQHALRTLDPAGLLRFFRFMLSPRHHNLLAFQNSFTETKGAFGIDACFAALVDFDHWLGRPDTPSPLRDQVLLHEQLAVLSGGYVLPLVPYNPWTDIKQDGKSFELVRWAVEKHGFVGVKIYPPMGYKPLGNEQPPPSNLERPDGKELDKSLRKLYDWCEKEDVPVMGHTAHSFGRDSAHDELGGPKSWELALTEYPSLKFNAGHFGGGYYLGEESIYWPAQFVEIMGKAIGHELYADLGYADELLNPTTEGFKRMKKLLEENPSALNRVMYGSDWSMSSQLDHWGAFAHGIDRFISSIEGIDVQKARRAVYFENAAKCFGLRKEQRNRKRLEKFYRRWKMKAPEWMEKLDMS
jgi:predicted TIM-barrel fold metal-dependent hydrolase